MANQTDHTVFVVEDEESARNLIIEMLAGQPWKVRPFETAEAFLAACDPEVAGCVLLDLKMPGINGLDVQAEMGRRGLAWPIIFVSGYGDIPSTVQAMKGGAIDFLSKPFKRQQLLDAVNEAMARAETMRAIRGQMAEIRAHYESLTAREKQVLVAVASGLTNKAVGIRFGISEKTIKVHRGRVMEKMQAGSLAELVLMAQQLGLCDQRVVRSASQPLKAGDQPTLRPTTFG